MKNRRADGRYQKWATVGKKPDGSPIRICVYADSTEALEQRVCEVKEEAKRGHVHKAPEITFADVAADWLEDRKAVLSKSSISGYRSMLNHSLLPILGGKPVKELSPADLQAAIDRAKKQGYSRQTLLDTKSAAVQIERFALPKGIISELRLNDITLAMGKSKGITETLSEEETALMLERSTGHEMCIPALPILLCGMRVGELRALVWADVKGRKLTVNKTVTNGKRQPTII